MKQLDLIVSAACIVIGFVACLIIIMTRRQPGAAPKAPQINTAPVQLPPAPVAFSNGLPGATGGMAGGPGGGGGGKRSGGLRS